MTFDAFPSREVLYTEVLMQSSPRNFFNSQATPVFNFAPGETLPFHAYTEKNPEIVRYDVTVDGAY